MAGLADLSPRKALDRRRATGLAAGARGSTVGPMAPPTPPSAPRPSPGPSIRGLPESCAPRSRPCSPGPGRRGRAPPRRSSPRTPATSTRARSPPTPSPPWSEDGPAGGAAALRKIVLLGPAHRVWVRGLALPGAEGFATPLGVVPVDPENAQAALRLPQVTVQPEAHAPEHSLEVELPFLQVLLGEFEVLPLVVGEADAAEVAEVLETVWGGDGDRRS